MTSAWRAPVTRAPGPGGRPPADQRATHPLPRGVTKVYGMTGELLPAGRSFELSPYPVYLVAPAAPDPSRVDPRAVLPNTSR
ncbi:MAG: hypothetical protein NVS3B24_19380 [Candidatus Dormibacteria bacterium]